MDGNAYGATDQNRFHMRRHVVGPFDRVCVGKTLRGNGVHGLFQVGRDVGIGVLVD